MTGTPGSADRSPPRIDRNGKPRLAVRPALMDPRPYTVPPARDKMRCMHGWLMDDPLCIPNPGPVSWYSAKAFSSGRV